MVTKQPAFHQQKLRVACQFCIVIKRARSYVNKSCSCSQSIVKRTCRFCNKNHLEKIVFIVLLNQLTRTLWSIKLHVALLVQGNQKYFLGKISCCPQWTFLSFWECSPSPAGYSASSPAAACSWQLLWTSSNSTAVFSTAREWWISSKMSRTSCHKHAALAFTPGTLNGLQKLQTVSLHWMDG